MEHDVHEKGGNCKINMPKISQAFLQHDKFKHILHHMIDDFENEEQIAIYFFCFADLTISEIAQITELSKKHVISALNLYSERLTSRLKILEKAIAYDSDEKASIDELLSLSF